MMYCIWNTKLTIHALNMLLIIRLDIIDNN